MTSDTRSDAVLRRLELDVTRRLDGILHGDHRGLVPGHGSEAGEAREYVAGDDVRRIDWNVTARTNHLHVRDTIADRELECWIVADRSASLDFGTGETEKAELLLSAAAGVGFLSARGGNRIGAIIVDESDCTVVPPRNGRQHLLAILRRISTVPRQTGRPVLDLAQTLHRAASVARRRGLVVVLSDFLDPVDSWRHPLAALGIRHEVLCAELVDPRELDLPAVGVLTLIDTETGARREIDTSRRSVREGFAEAARERRLEIDRAIRGAGADHLSLRTDADWLAELARFVTTRRRRRANSGGLRAGAPR